MIFNDQVYTQPVFVPPCHVEDLKVALILMPLFRPGYPPLGLASAKSYLCSHGVKAYAFDLNHYFYHRAPESLQKEWHISNNTGLTEKIFDLLRTQFRATFDVATRHLSGYDVAVFSCHRGNLQATRRMIHHIKRRNQSLKAVLCGPEITHRIMYKDQLERKLPEADYFIAGDIEKPLYTFLSGNAGTKKIAPMQSGPESREMPLPDLSDFSLEQYQDKNTVPIIASRGCSQNCAFCIERHLSVPFRNYPIDNVLEQIRSHWITGPGRYFIFTDSIINADCHWLEQMSQAIIRRFTSVPWQAQAYVRPDMPESCLAKMKTSGCRYLTIGLESGCDKTLNRMNKTYTSATALELFKRLKAHGISFGINIITGFPGETKDEFDQNLEFVIKNKEYIDNVEQVNPFVFYKGLALDMKLFDYRINRSPLERARIFIETIRREGISHKQTNFLNLVEPRWKFAKLPQTAS